jgi:hypothetical protein
MEFENKFRKKKLFTWIVERKPKIYLLILEAQKGCIRGRKEFRVKINKEGRHENNINNIIN